MKVISILALIVLQVHASSNQPRLHWNWLKGSSFTSSDFGTEAAVLGTKGVPDEANTPGPGYQSFFNYFQMAQSPLWISVNSSSVIYFAFQEDWDGSKYALLWKLGLDDFAWTWIQGQEGAQLSLYGKYPGSMFKNVYSESNSPAARSEACYFTWRQEHYLFGGYDATPIPISYGGLPLWDLWKLQDETMNWAWVYGCSPSDSTCIPDLTKSLGGDLLCWTPYNDSDTMFHVFNQSHLWSFNLETLTSEVTVLEYVQFNNEQGTVWSGPLGLYYFGVDSEAFFSEENTLWKYDFDQPKFVVVQEASADTNTVHGDPGEFSPTYIPSARTRACILRSLNGNIFLVGGERNGLLEYEIFEFDVYSEQWSYVTGEAPATADPVWGDIRNFSENPFSHGFGTHACASYQGNHFLYGGHIPAISGDLIMRVSHDLLYMATECKPRSESDVLLQAQTCSKLCFDGLFYDLDTLECAACSPGKFNNEPSPADCSSCSIGTFSSSGQSSCLKCPTGRFAAETSQGICAKCPELSYSKFPGSSSEHACECIPGAYGDPKSGKPCVPCQDGLICAQDNTKDPLVLPGYRLFKDGDYNNESGYELFKCQPPEACELNQCINTYSGKYCDSCIIGNSYRDGLTCRDCGSSNLSTAAKVVLSAFGFLVFAFVLAIEAVPSSSKTYSLGICFSWLQIMEVLRSIPTNWPYSISMILNSFSFLNFNIDGLSLECSDPKASFWMTWVIKLSVPLLGAGALMFWFAISCTSQALFPKSRSIFSRDLRELIEDVFWKKRIWSSAKTYHEDPFAKSRFVYALVTMLTFFYTSFSTTSFQIFNCFKKFPDKQDYYLLHSPDVLCYTGTWLKFLPLSVFGIICYVLLFPVICVIWIRRNENQINSLTFLKTFGSLTLPYRSNSKYWEQVNFFRKFALSALLQFVLLRDQAFQVITFSLTVLFLLLLLLNSTCTPYNDETSSFLAASWNLCALVFLSCAIVLQQPDGILLKVSSVEMFLIASICFQALLSLYIVVKDIRKSKRDSKIQKLENQKPWDLRIDLKMAILKWFPDSSHEILDQLELLSFREQKEWLSLLQRTIEQDFPHVVIQESCQGSNEFVN